MIKDRLIAAALTTLLAAPTLAAKSSAATKSPLRIQMRSLIVQGNTRLQAKDYAGALKSFHAAMRLYPFDPMPALYAAQARYVMRDFGNSSTSFELSLRRARRTRSYPALAQRVRTDPMFAGLTQIPQNRAMLRIYDEVEKGKMSEAQARIRLEEMAAYRDTLRDAPRSDVRRRFEPAREDPEAQARIDLGIQHMKTNRFPEAVEAFRKTLQEDISKGTLTAFQRSDLWARVGICYRQLGIPPKAIEALKRSSSENPENYSAYYQLALTYSVLQDYPKALGALQLGLRNATSPAELRRTLLLAKVDPEFDSLRKYPAFSKILTRHARRLPRRG